MERRSLCRSHSIHCSEWWCCTSWWKFLKWTRKSGWIVRRGPHLEFLHDDGWLAVMTWHDSTSFIILISKWKMKCGASQHSSKRSPLNFLIYVNWYDALTMMRRIMMKPKSWMDENFLINSLVLCTCCHVLIVSKGCPNTIPQAGVYSVNGYATKSTRGKVFGLLIYLMCVLWCRKVSPTSFLFYFLSISGETFLA